MIQSSEPTIVEGRLASATASRVSIQSSHRSRDARTLFFFFLFFPRRRDVSIDFDLDLAFAPSIRREKFPSFQSCVFPLNFRSGIRPLFPCECGQENSANSIYTMSTEGAFSFLLVAEVLGRKFVYVSACTPTCPTFWHGAAILVRDSRFGSVSVKCFSPEVALTFFRISVEKSAVRFAFPRQSERERERVACRDFALAILNRRLLARMTRA